VADIFTSDFEGATPFSGWDVAAATVTQNVSVYHGGAASAKHDGVSGAAPLLTENIAGAPTTLVSQFWFYVPTSMPGGYSFVFGQMVCSGFFGYVTIKSTSTNTIAVQLTNGVSTDEQTGTFARDTWTRLTTRLITNPAVTCDWNLATTEKTQVVWSGGGTTTVSSFKLGSVSVAAGLIHYTDDVRLSTTGSDYDVYKGAVSTVPRMALLGVG
jgi:hypothetical protein